jgi:hypothetical protein
MQEGDLEAYLEAPPVTHVGSTCQCVVRAACSDISQLREVSGFGERVLSFLEPPPDSWWSYQDEKMEFGRQAHLGLQADWIRAADLVGESWHAEAEVWDSKSSTVGHIDMLRTMPSPTVIMDQKSGSVPAKYVGQEPNELVRLQLTEYAVMFAQAREKTLPKLWVLNWPRATSILLPSRYEPRYDGDRDCYKTSGITGWVREVPPTPGVTIEAIRQKVAEYREAYERIAGRQHVPERLCVPVERWECKMGKTVEREKVRHDGLRFHLERGEPAYCRCLECGFDCPRLG